MTSLCLLIIVLIYCFTLSNSIYGGDAGDLVSAIITKGFSHPPGYALYTSLGILINKVNVNFLTPAGKVTMISLLATVASLYFLLRIIKIIFTPGYYNRWLAICLMAVAALNYIVWLYAIVPEVFPLNTLIVLMIYYFSLAYYESRRVINLYFISLLTGLGICHHHTFILVIPSVMYLLWSVKAKIKMKKNEIFVMAIIFLIGLLPNLRLYFATVNKSAIIWGNADTLTGFLSVLLRAGYGTFVAGSFISNVPQHRFLQLKNLLLMILNDFTLLGTIGVIIAIIYYLKISNKKLRVFFNSLLINIFFFGPFFFFYANFPLTGGFFFATLERFLHTFYFFLTIAIYFGLFIIFRSIYQFINFKINHILLNKLTYFSIASIFIIYPAGELIRNYRAILALKNDQTAEKLGLDVLMNAQKKSIILLSQDTIIFNTQYVYYTNSKLQKERIIIHTSKLASSYYPIILKNIYPQLKIDPERKKINSVEDFINQNKENFLIFANEKYPLDKLKNYIWLSQGILYQLVKKDEIDKEKNKEIINGFWQQSLNRDLEKRVTSNDLVFKNLFAADALRVYAIGHQNSAFFFLENNFLDQGYQHIKSASILQPDDLDNYYLLSYYWQKKNQCRQSLAMIEKALDQSTDSLYLNQLKDIGNNCFRTEGEKKEVLKKLNDYEKKTNLRLKRF